MEYASLTTEAEQFIERDELGNPLQVYGPPTASTLTSNIFALVLLVSMGGFCLYVLIWNMVRVAFSWSVIELNGGFILALSIFFLASLAAFIFCARNIFKAISNRNRRVVICTHGVAVVERRNTESFRWQEVLTVFTLPRYKARPIYTVNCRDGRRFVFQDISGIEQLAESIEVRVARAKKS